MIFLENEFIKASIAPKGAELQSLISKKNNREYLWNGNPEYWGKFSPVLFPIVGALKDNSYYYKGEMYSLSRHGFARDHDFTFEQSNKQVVTFTLTQSESTLKVYPFNFILKLRYELSDIGLSCTYIVSNPDDKELLFSVGGHPAFAVKTDGNINYSDYFLEFNKDQHLEYYKIKGDLIDEETNIVDLAKDRSLQLTHELFYKDALVFKTLKSNCISLKNTKNDSGLNFHFDDFPFFGIWAAKDADFVCLEPWCGIADAIGHNQNLEEKAGIVSLAPQTQWERRWSIECF